jgi:hypothetical protein
MGSCKLKCDCDAGMRFEAARGVGNVRFAKNTSKKMNHKPAMG